LPIIVSYIPSGHTPDSKIALLHSVTNAVVKSLGAPLASIRVVLQECAPEFTMVAGKLGDAPPLFVVYLIEGRDADKKAALIAELNKAACESLKVSAQDSRVIIRDVPKTDMGVAGGISALAAGR
jgi:4-oxalocrotonate tautomerase